jgi:Uma2 family endonuclease
MEHESPADTLTYQQFLDFVAHKEGRYEYVAGRAVAMGIPSNEHQDIALIVGSALRDHLRTQNCKVRLSAPLFTIRRIKKPGDDDQERAPDIMVTCDEADLVLGNRLNRKPKLLIEVLSPQNGDDLDLKLDEYEAIPTVEEYIIIDSRKRSIRRWYRASTGKFEFDPFYISGTMHFLSVGYRLDIDALYAEVGIP